MKEEHSDLTLKSMGVTRWSCRWQAVKAVFEQMPKIVRALLSLSLDRHVKTYTDSSNLLNAIGCLQWPKFRISVDGQV